MHGNQWMCMQLTLNLATCTKFLPTFTYLPDILQVPKEPSAHQCMPHCMATIFIVTMHGNQWMCMQLTLATCTKFLPTLHTCLIVCRYLKSHLCISACSLHGYHYDIIIIVTMHGNQCMCMQLTLNLATCTKFLPTLHSYLPDILQVPKEPSVHQYMPHCMATIFIITMHGNQWMCM